MRILKILNYPPQPLPHGEIRPTDTFYINMKKIDQKNPKFIRLWLRDFLPVLVTYLSIFGQPKFDTGCHFGQ